MGERYNFLRTVYFFSMASDEDIRLVADLCHESAHESGELLCREGDDADRFYIIVEGEVEVWRDYGSDRAELLAVHGMGKTFGEMALIDELPRSASAVAKGKVRVLWIARDEFHALLKTRISIAYGLLLSISGMVRASNDAYVLDLRRQYAKLEKAYGELKEAQASLLRNERLSTLGKFSSMILHDIRNPVSVLRGQLQLLALNAENPEKRERYLGNAQNELDRLERLSGEFLDYSRGEIRLNFNIVTPSCLFERLRSGTADAFAKSGLRFAADPGDDAPFLADSDRILRVFFNIADNARKAMRPGDSLELRARTEGSTKVFELEDSGEGMSPETLGHVFEPFFSAAGGGGTGLGMLIVKNIVEAHNGTIGIESERGKGTTVTIRLPSRS